MTDSKGGSSVELASRSSRRSNVGVALTFLVVTAVGAIGAVMVETDDLGSDPGPVSYPAFVLVLMGICGVLLFFSKDHSAEEGEQGGKHRGMVLLIAAALLIYIVLLGALGYIASTALFIFIALLIAKERRWLALLAYSIIVPLAIYYVFSEALGVLLPTGVVEGLL